MLRKLLVIGLFAAAAAFAQDETGGGGGGGGPRAGGGGGGMMGGGGGFGQARETPSDKFNSLLTLEKDQRKALKSLMDETAKGAVPLRDQIVKTQAALGAALFAQKADEIQKLAAELAAQKAQMTQVEGKAFTGIWNLLTSEQRKKPCAGSFGRPATACVAQAMDLIPGSFMRKNWDSAN